MKSKVLAKFNIDDFINEYKSLFTEEELAEAKAEILKKEEGELNG